jgi:hypothetical protein
MVHANQKDSCVCGVIFITTTQSPLGFEHNLHYSYISIYIKKFDSVLSLCRLYAGIFVLLQFIKNRDPGIFFRKTGETDPFANSECLLWNNYIVPDHIYVGRLWLNKQPTKHASGRQSMPQGAKTCHVCHHL